LGSKPRGAGPQIPGDAARPQYWQVPLQALLQQYPSTQLLLAHSPLLAQAVPCGFFWQTLLIQKRPAAHWDVIVHDVGQLPLPPLQR
jgi:hypothetical protein